MPDTLCFSRNRCTCVEQVDDQTLRSTCRLQDNLMDARVEILVRLPDLELVHITGEISRPRQEEGEAGLDSLQKLVGARVGPGIKKIIWSVIEHSPYAGQVANLVDECCNGVILSFARDVLALVPNDKQAEKEFFTKMVKDNPRLYNSCAALTPDSPLLEGLELDQG